MTTAKQKKGDTSNEVKRGTFLTRLDTKARRYIDNKWREAEDGGRLE
jgi:hypothetical protein